jgi:hypothetical protein
MKKKPLSAVAGILSPEGYFRVVVTERWRMKNHIAKGEKLFVVPGYRVEEPVPWDHIPLLIRKVELYIEWWITTRNAPIDSLNIAVQNYLRNPNASHNLHRDWYHPPGLYEAVRATA